MTRPPVSGATTLAGVIGDPVTHSLSPALHNAGYEALGLDWNYVAFPVPAGQAREAVAAMREMRIRGLSVTMPHKEAVAAAADQRSETVAALGAANTLVRSDDGLVTALSTDGDGFVAGLAAEVGLEPVGLRVAVIGAGGAARAVVEACARAGAAAVDVVNRTPERAEVAASLAGDIGGIASEVGDHDLVINTTPLGMEADDPMPCLPESLGLGTVVVDAIYHPAQTPWLAACRARGLRGSNGFPMLLHQAALQFELFTGHAAPLGAMRAAAPREVLR